MTMLKNLIATIGIGGLLAGSSAVSAAESANGQAKEKPYPLKTCVVSGEKLGSMGKPYIHKYEGREVQLCCKGCVKTFSKDPSQYLKKIDAAEKAGKAGKSQPKAPAHDHSGHSGHQH